MHDSFGSSTRKWKAQYNYTSGLHLPAADAGASSSLFCNTDGSEEYSLLSRQVIKLLSHNCLVCDRRRLWRSARTMGGNYGSNCVVLMLQTCWLGWGVL